jgi:hypothetical protein
MLEDNESLLPSPVFEEWWNCFSLRDDSLMPGGKSSFSVSSHIIFARQWFYLLAACMPIDDPHRILPGHAGPLPVLPDERRARVLDVFKRLADNGVMPWPGTMLGFLAGEDVCLFDRRETMFPAAERSVDVSLLSALHRYVADTVGGPGLGETFIRGYTLSLWAGAKEIHDSRPCPLEMEALGIHVGALAGNEDISLNTAAGEAAAARGGQPLIGHPIVAGVLLGMKSNALSLDEEPSSDLVAPSL